VREVVTVVAQRRGQHEDEFYSYNNTTMTNVVAMVLALERQGLSAEETLQNIVNFRDALRSPAKLRILECVGVHTTDPKTGKLRDTTLLLQEFGERARTAPSNCGDGQ
jgi:hypothetical protein